VPLSSDFLSKSVYCRYMVFSEELWLELLGC
jgi:hypothetical protein